jgi:hypothetical protein
MPIIPGISASSNGHQPGTPTIGTATTSGTNASVPFTAPSYLGKPTGTSYVARAYNTSGVASGLTGTNTASPVSIAGLSYSTSYKFTIELSNSVTTSVVSGFSNTVTTEAAPPFFPYFAPPFFPFFPYFPTFIPPPFFFGLGN